MIKVMKTAQFIKFAIPSPPPPPLQHQPSTTHATPLKMNVKPPLISKPDVMEFLLDVFGDQSKKPKNSKSADCNSVMVHQ